MSYADRGAVFVLALLALVLIGFGLYGLFMWVFVHNKLRAERKEDAASKSARRKNLQKGQSGMFVTLGLGVLGVVIALFLVLASGAEVGYGNVGVVSSWGSLDAKQTPLDPGFHMVMPFATHIESVSVQPQNHNFREVAAASKELQNVYVDGGINYQIAPNQAAELTVNGGSEAIITKVLDPAFQDYIKEVVPHYQTTDLLANRGQIRDQVLALLQAKADPYGITVKDVFITNIHFDKAYTDAIENAAVSQQKLAQAKIDAQTAVAKAQGDADAARTAAAGQADANRAIAQSITPELIQYREIDKWKGDSPQVVSGTGQIISLPLQK